MWFVCSHWSRRKLASSRHVKKRKEKIDIIITMDADNQHNVEDLKKFIHPLISNKADIVIGSRVLGSNKSKNIINVAKLAQKKQIFTIAFLGSGWSNVKKYANLNLIIPSKSTARIQELHIFLGHYIFEEVEKLLIK